MRRKAFTLVELLVVLAIIATLLSILVPSLLRAQSIAARVTCTSNLRQMFIASQTSASNNDGYYPLAWEQVTGSDSLKNCWDFMDSKLGDAKLGFLWDGQNTVKLPRCPLAESTVMGNPTTGYNYNSSYIGGNWTHASVSVSKFSMSQSSGTSTSATEKLNPSARISDVKHPATCAIFGDGQNASGTEKFMRSPLPGLLDKTWPDPSTDPSFNATQGFRHMGQTNVGYCDGSVFSEKKCYTKIIGNLAVRIASGTGFLSPDNSAYDRE